MSDKARGSKGAVKKAAKQSTTNTTKSVKAGTTTNSTSATKKPAGAAKKSAAKTAKAAKAAKTAAKNTTKASATVAKAPRTAKAATNAIFRGSARPPATGARTVVEPADTAEELPPRSVDSSHAEFVAATSLAPLANPLRDRQDRRLPHMPEPCALVVFGITGDLAQKKLLPAIYDIANRGLLPANFVLIGFARRDWVDGDFASLAHDAAKEHARTAWDEGVWNRLANNIKFVPGSFDDDLAFDRLARTLTELSDSHGIIGNAAFYLSIPPALFETVLRQIERTGMADNHKAGGWRRVVVEKPFGHDLPSSKQLNDLVDDVFTWRDVYRIDHYLGKETVQNLFAFRFANTLFEPVWNSHYVDSVQITMAEDVGIGGRAAFYDKTGAARDVLQNHLLQLLALTAMEEPVRFIPSAIRTEKLKVLRAISLPADLRGNAIRGQYKQGWLAGERAVGYLQENDVPDDSTTETFAAIKLHIETRRWAGVPFYLRTGKRLPRRVTEIALTFRQAPHLPFAPTDTDELGHNQLVIRVQPDEGVTLRFGSKVPGTVMEVRDVAMDFQYGETFTEGSPEAYERLLLDVLLGDATLFPLNEEVEASWAVVDQLEDFWAGQKPFDYRAGEWGPPEADRMLARDGRGWRRP